MFARSTTALNLRQLYYLNVYGGTARGRDGTAPDSLSDDLDALTRRISSKLRDGSYRFTAYKQLLVSKGADKAPRVLSVPAARDRITLRAIADFLGEVYPHAKGVIPQVRVAQVQRTLGDSAFDSFIRVDIKEFYPSIQHHKIESALSVRIRKRAPLDVVMAAIQTPTLPDRASSRARNRRGVPQGLSISNLLAEMVVAPVDDFFTGREDCEYFRFVDDILILCKKADVAEFSKAVDHELRQCGLEMHPLDRTGSKSRSGVVSDGFEYLGYHFIGECTSVRRSSVYKVESSLARVFTRYKNAAIENEVEARRICLRRVNLVITGCIYEDNPYGWLHYFRQMNDQKLLKELDSTVIRMVKRFRMSPDFTTKSFTRAYWAIRHPNGRDRGYIPRFDNLNEEQMRTVLSDFIGVARAYELPASAVPRAFKRVMKQVTSDLERDIVAVS